MKVIKLLLLLILVSGQSKGQDSTWVIQSFNSILTLGLPLNTQVSEQSYVKVHTGSINGDFFAFNYYDTLIKVEDGRDFQIGLTGFVHGLMKNVPENQFETTLGDAAIGGTKGILLRFVAKDSAASIKQLFYYVTLANNHYYSFQVACSRLNAPEEEVNEFFDMIKFEANKVKENSFQIDSVLIK